MHIASEPSHFPEDALAPSDEANKVVEAFLAQFPEGTYEVEGVNVDRGQMEGEATLSHILPALPEIVAPVSDNNELLPVVDSNALVIEWEPVTTRFIGEGPLEIVGYQVIVEQVDPFRMLTINLPASSTGVSVQPEFLEPGQLYDFEVVAFEATGNATISVGEFVTSE